MLYFYKGGVEMTFKKGFIWGYLVFVLAMAIVYFTIPREHSLIALISVAILFGLYQFVLNLQIKKERKN